MRGRRHVAPPIAQRPEAALPRGDRRSQRRIRVATGVDLAALGRIERAEHVLGRQSVDVVVLGH